MDLVMRFINLHLISAGSSLGPQPPPARLQAERKAVGDCPAEKDVRALVSSG